VGELRVEARSPDAGGALSLHWRGVCNERDPATFLEPYLAKALDEARGARVGLELHFEKMEYCNSSTLGALIDFTERVLGAGIKLVYVFDASRRWQQLSFEALRVFDSGDGLLELRAETPPAGA
jgi:hypothetical protein